MAGPGTHFTGPVISGPSLYPNGTTPADAGLAVLSQVATLVVNGTNAVTAQFALPYGSQIVDILADTTTAWNSGTSDTLSVGATAGGTDYASGISVSTAGRVRPTYTATQLENMLNISGNTAVYATVTPVGTAATTGSTTVTLLYVQTVQLTAGTA